jgi:hypothetical protein
VAFVVRKTIDFFGVKENRKKNKNILQPTDTQST